MKKILLLNLCLLSTLLISPQTQTTKVEDPLSPISIKKAASEGEIKHSRIYHQNGKNSNGNYCLRLATAVYGDFDAISYFVKVDGFHDDFIKKDISVVYKGIKAESENVYFDGTNLTSTETEGWYWACYTIEYSSSQYYSADVSAYVEISSSEETKTASLETGNISLAQSIKALDSKITNRKYTGTLSIDENNKKVTTLEYVDNRLVANVDGSTYTLKYASYNEGIYNFLDENNNTLNVKVENNHLTVNGTLSSQTFIDSVLNVDLGIKNTRLYLNESKLTLEYEGNAFDLAKEDLVFEYAKLDPWPWVFYTPDFTYTVNDDTFKISVDLSSLSSTEDKNVDGNVTYQKYIFYCQMKDETRTGILASTYTSDTRPMALQENNFVAIPYSEWGPAALKITNGNISAKETDASIYKKEEKIYVDVTITGTNLPVEDIIGVQTTGADDWITRVLPYTISHDGKYITGSSNDSKSTSFTITVDISSLPVSTGDVNGHCLTIKLSNGKTFNIGGSSEHTEVAHEEFNIDGKIYKLRGIWGNFSIVIPA